jgi:hypothetical protein
LIFGGKNEGGGVKMGNLGKIGKGKTFENVRKTYRNVRKKYRNVRKLYRNV